MEGGKCYYYLFSKKTTQSTTHLRMSTDMTSESRSVAAKDKPLLLPPAARPPCGGS
jgi:hypothetical protein